MLTDWVTCKIPDTFFLGFDPHTLTAYRAPAEHVPLELRTRGQPSRAMRSP